MGEDKNPVLGGDAAEAQAEEAFINEQEDTVNPLIDNGDAPAAEPADDLLGDNAVGSGNLEAPASTEPVNNEQTPAAEQPATSVVDQPVATATPADPAKKKKTGMIVGIIVAAVLLIGGIVGALIFVSIHESKEYIQADAFKKFFGVKLAGGELESSTDGALIGATQFDGTATFKFGDEAEATLTMSSKSSGINEISENTLAVKYDGKDFKIKVSAAYFKGGSFYLKLNEIADLRDALIDAVSDGTNTDSESVKDLVKKVFKSAIDVLEDQWIVINADTFEELGYKDEYTCVMNEFDKLAEGDQKKDLLKAYKDNQFLSFSDPVEKDKIANAKDGLTYYELKVDEEKYKNFAEAVRELDYSDRFEKCFDSSKSGVSATVNRLAEFDDDDYDFDLDEEYDEDDYDWTYDDELEDVAPVEDVKITTYIGVKGWSHEAQHIVVNTSDDSVKVDMAVGYDKQDLQEPSAKSLKEVAESLFNAAKGTIIDEKKTIVDICEEQNKGYGDECEEVVGDFIDDLDDMSFDDLIDKLKEPLDEPDYPECDVWDDDENCGL